MSQENETNMVNMENAVINLQVERDRHCVVNFKIKRNAPLRKLMEAYCKNTNTEMKQVRFLFDGERINPEDATAASLGMEDGDVISLVQEQDGGAMC